MAASYPPRCGYYLHTASVHPDGCARVRKTSILSRLSAEFMCIGEPAGRCWRSSAQSMVAALGTRTHPSSCSCSWNSIEKYETGRMSDRTVVFDRGIPDCAVYSLQLGTDPTHVLDAIDVYGISLKCSSSNRGGASIRPMGSASCYSMTRSGSARRSRDCTAAPATPWSKSPRLGGGPGRLPSHDDRPFRN